MKNKAMLYRQEANIERFIQQAIRSCSFLVFPKPTKTLIKVFLVKSAVCVL